VTRWPTNPVVVATFNGLDLTVHARRARKKESGEGNREAVRPHVSTVIPGMITPVKIDMNVTDADGKPFPAEMLEQLPGHSWPRNFYQ
jgi:hypothetical protein